MRRVKNRSKVLPIGTKVTDKRGNIGILMSYNNNWCKECSMRCKIGIGYDIEERDSFKVTGCGCIYKKVKEV